MKKLIYALFLMAIFTNNSYSQWNSEYMSGSRCQLQSAKMGDEIYFIGGNDGALSSTIDVYNTTLESWMPGTNISSPRCFTASVGGDSALYVAGGLESFAGSFVGTNTVDIYKNGSWSTYTLADSIWAAVAVHVGSKILIGGAVLSYNPSTGIPIVSDLVYVFDELTNTWSTDTLSEARGFAAVATDGTIAIFAGGIRGPNQVSNVVDIYSSITDTWTTDTLSEARGIIAGIYAGGKFYFAGGARAGVNNSSDVIDIYDGTNWTTAQLSNGRAGLTACTAGDKVFFAGGGDNDLTQWYYTSSTSLVDVYDITLESWSNNNMDFDKINHTAIGSGDKVYVAGGVDASTGNLLDAVEVWDVTTGIHSLEQFNKISAYPNPASDVITIAGMEDISNFKEMEITTCSGSIISKIETAHRDINISDLASGLYFLNIKRDDGTVTIKFIKD